MISELINLLIAIKEYLVPRFTVDLNQGNVSHTPCLKYIISNILYINGGQYLSLIIRSSII